MKFSQILKNLRDEKDINQEELAKVINISRSSITQYETDRNSPTSDILEKLASFFDVSVDYLLGRTTIRNIEKTKQTMLPDELKDFEKLSDSGKDFVLNALQYIEEQEKNKKE